MEMNEPAGRGLREQAIVSLADARAADPFLTGGKASALARAFMANLPVLPGLVLTTAADHTIDLDAEARFVKEGLLDALVALSGFDSTLVVRSSSTIEDAEESSMAGRFVSVIGVRGHEEIASAITTVLESAGNVASRAPMAVLIQPYLEARVGGIMFSVDPVAGRADRMLVSAAAGGPHRLVDGTATGARYVLARSGRIVESEHAGEAALKRAERRALARLAKRAEEVFGGPQDIEWAIDEDGRLWLLQARPVTATGRVHDVTGPVFGPGPVAETFPAPLTALERDMWLDPLRAAIVEALRFLHAAPRGRIKSSPVVIAVGGRVAADLELLGHGHRKSGFLARLDPRPSARRLAAAWNAGRLRAALPKMASHLAASVDCGLGEIPSLGRQSDAQLHSIVAAARRMLVALHGHEVLAGMMLRGDEGGATAASAALRTIAAARRAGVPDHRITAAAPVVLALSPPSVGGRLPLPAAAEPPAVTHVHQDPMAIAREELRMRIRWTQELQARAAYELGRRLTASGRLARPEHVALLSMEEFFAAALTGAVPDDVSLRAVDVPGAPLPAAFRLTLDGAVVAEAGDPGGGSGAGGGRGSGVVWAGRGSPPRGSVLVVRTLDPSLAVVLPGLGGLVSETGSVLSHLAILAREYGIPTVVGVDNALDRFPPGSSVVVDGIAGTVALVDEAAA